MRRGVVVYHNRFEAVPLIREYSNRRRVAVRVEGLNDPVDW
jgi:hypothetical protein